MLFKKGGCYIYFFKEVFLYWIIYFFDRVKCRFYTYVIKVGLYELYGVE